MGPPNIQARKIVTYRSSHSDCRQLVVLTAINSNYKYRIVLPEELISITETDLWEGWQKNLALQMQT